jgi:NtrC-family two-component system response regulator AlgB
MSLAAKFHVLVIDDEKNIRTTLTMCLEGMGADVAAVATPEAALAAINRSAYDLAFLDLRLANANGLDVIPQLLAAAPGLNIVVITAYATFDTAVEAIKRGARDYLPKPFSPAQIRHMVEQVQERQALTHRLSELEVQRLESAPDIDFDTASPRMRAVLQMALRVAQSDTTVLLRGENGTGKGVLARLLHTQSERRTKPFVMVNCPTLSEELLASELFGHAKGAFTGAVRDQTGRVEAAQGGTLFLDEIGEISPGLQAKLLRFLQDKQFERVGETKTRQADVRVLAATNRDLEEDVRTGRFREDLLYRLNVIELRLPTLRERREDILQLARSFLQFFARTTGRPSLELSQAAEAVLLSYPWPGNVRELRNAIERAVILWPAQVIEPEAFPDRIATHVKSEPVLGGNYTLDTIEREHLLRVLARTTTLEEAAQILGIDASTLWRKRKKYEESV